MKKILSGFALALALSGAAFAGEMPGVVLDRRQVDIDESGSPQHVSSRIPQKAGRLQHERRQYQDEGRRPGQEPGPRAHRDHQAAHQANGYRLRQQENRSRPGRSPGAPR